jgi:hypothetical protein
LPKSRNPDPGKAAADAAYVARAARVMRWVVRLAILATVVVLYFMIEPLASSMISGSFEEEMRLTAEQRMKEFEQGREPEGFFMDHIMKRTVTIMGGFVMLFLLVALNFALGRMEKAGPKRET